MSAKTWRRLLVSLALAVLVSSLMSLALMYGLLRPIQLQASDLLFRLKPDTKAKWAVIVAIDDHSLAQLRSSGRFFNWPRTFHAQVIDNLKAAGARMIVWDVLFDLPAEGDAELARAIREANNVILAEVGDPATALPPTAQHRRRFGEALQQLPELRAGAHAIGSANQETDVDGAIRTMPVIFNVAGEDVPALPLVAAAKHLRRPQVLEGPIRNGKLPFAGREIPLDQEDRMWIAYLGDSSEATNSPTFPTLSFVDVLNNTFSPDVVRSKTVFVGITATAFADDFWTPVSRSSKMDGVEIHANAFETITNVREQGQFIVPASPQLTIGLIFLGGILALLALQLLSPVPAVILCTVAAVGYLAVAVSAVDQLSLILDLPFPMLNQALCFLAILMYRVIFEQAQQRALRGALAQYLSPDIMEEVARDPGAIKLGGEKRVMTVLFSDIRGFTSLSEQLEPEQLVHLLNIYLTRMSDVIFKHQGTIDKYMGDAIMAFWGAPREQPEHARMACLAALEMVDELAKLNAEFAAEGIPPLNIGIGLNTGTMSVGNMGSERRFDYTVMGDSVNLGSRLEGLNKEYATNVIVAETTLAQAGADIRSRFIDLVAVKGKKEPTAVYELISSNGKVDEKVQAVLGAYERGLECYKARDYLGAVPHFETALRLNPQDGASAVYLERCKDLAANPPPADWDGVYVMTHK